MRKCSNIFQQKRRGGRRGVSQTQEQYAAGVFSRVDLVPSTARRVADKQYQLIVNPLLLQLVHRAAPLPKERLATLSPALFAFLGAGFPA